MCHDLQYSRTRPELQTLFFKHLRCVALRYVALVLYTKVQYAIVDMLIFLSALRMYVSRSLRYCLTLSFG